MMGGAKSRYDGIVVFSQTDFTEDLKMPTTHADTINADLLAFLKS